MGLPVFISWSGDQSKSFALHMKEWIPEVLQNTETFMSDDIAAGARWSNEIAQSLEKSGYGVICLTQENLVAPWILYEAGALSKMVTSSFVTPILIGVERSKVQFPLQQFQSVTVEKNELFKLFVSINSRCDAPLEELRLRKTFERSFSDYEQKFHDLSNVTKHKTAHNRLDKDSDTNSAAALNEVLKSMQSIQVMLSNPDNLFPTPRFERIIENLRRELLLENSRSR